MKVDFWQLSRDGADTVVALIAQRVLDRGERLLVVSDDPKQRSDVSRALWKAGPESFLAHGEASGAGAARQPILLTDTPKPLNGASHVVFADGNWRDPGGFDRAFLLFDDDTVADARATWKTLGGSDDLERAFFRQENGKWVKVA